MECRDECGDTKMRLQRNLANALVERMGHIGRMTTRHGYGATLDAESGCCYMFGVIGPARVSAGR
jgi:hypothetical protein